MTYHPRGSGTYQPHRLRDLLEPREAPQEQKCPKCGRSAVLFSTTEGAQCYGCWSRAVKGPSLARKG